MVRPGRRRRTDGPDSGVAAVELAIILPILIGVIMLAVVAGTAAVGQLRLDAAARDGARAGAVVPGGGCTNALTRLGVTVGDGGPTLGTVTCTAPSVCPGNVSTVSLGATRTVTMPLVGERNIDLSADATFDCQITG
ncbi:MAG: hypothetical protein RIR49_901 [Actinomycetota bacterium]|jgi:hypothetical protein